MAGPNYGLAKGHEAAAAITQFRAVKLTGTEKVTPASVAKEQVLGICQDTITADDATQGRVAAVLYSGISRTIAGDAITQFARVATDSVGRVVPLVAPGAQVGIALQAASNAGEHVDVFLTPGVYIANAAGSEVVGDQPAIADLALTPIDASSGEVTAAALDDANTNQGLIEDKINAIIAALESAGLLTP